MYVVAVTTVPGYPSLVAVTSIWHLLEQDTEGLGAELALGTIV